MARSVPSTDGYGKMDSPVRDPGNGAEQGQVAISSLPGESRLKTGSHQRPEAAKTL